MRAYIVLAAVSFSLMGCLDGGQNFVFCPADLEGDALDSCESTLNPVSQSIEYLVEDSFERDQFIPESDALSFWGRKIIDDRGRVSDGVAGDNIDVAIFSDDRMGVMKDQSRGLLFYGRAGWSVHDLYAVSRTFDVSQLSHLSIELSYLAIDLEEDDYISIDVCNSSLADCGVADELNIEGLNSDHWESIYYANGEGDGLDGHNHSVNDWKSVKLFINRDHLSSHELTFRVTVRMNDGFMNNQVYNTMDDGVIVDAIKVRAVKEGVNPDILL